MECPHDLRSGHTGILALWDFLHCSETLALSLWLVLSSLQLPVGLRWVDSLFVNVH